MAKKFIGKTKIELTNVRTGKTEVIEEKNMLTNRLYKILNTNPMGMVNPDIVMPIVGRIAGGVVLFPDTKVEDPENDILFDDFTAYAQLNANGTTDTSRGSWNFVESGPIRENGKDGYKMVWDWTTSQGNGTYQCVSLTNPFVSKNRWDFCPATNFPSYGYRSHTVNASNAGTESYELTRWAQAYDEETGFFYNISNLNNTQMLLHRGRMPMHKILLGETPLYGTSGYLGNLPACVVNGVSKLVHEYENRTITLNYEIFTNSYCNSLSFRRENGVPYIYIFSIPYSVSSSFRITKINVDTYEIVEEKEMRYSGASFKPYSYTAHPRPQIFPHIGNYIFLPKKDDDSTYTSRKHFYKVNLLDTSDITMLPISEEIQNSDAADMFSNANAGYVIQNKYGYWWVKDRFSKSNNKYTVGLCNDEMILLNAYSQFNQSSDNYINSFVLNNTWIVEITNSNNNNYFVPELSNHYMLSINNLSEPITKTSEQLMKITYTLIEADE